MAGDWIPMRLDLAEDPAVLEMAEILGESEEYIVGSLHKIWSWASRQCHDGTVTGVTVSSLSRAVKLPTVVVAMVNVGWLIEGKNDAGRPFIAFPKWENWLSKSAKSRLNNSINQRNSRANKSTAVNLKQNPGGEGVTDLSLSDSDKPVTTGEKSTEEDNSNINSTVIKHIECLSRDIICPEWLKPEFCRWLAFRESVDGKRVPPQVQEQWAFELNARGQDKALADIAFSISKQSKNLCKAENDFQELFRRRMEAADSRHGKQSVGGRGNRLRAAEELRKAIEEDEKNGH